MASAGLGPLGIIKSESAQVAVGTLGITLAGLLLGKVWFMSGALMISRPHADGARHRCNVCTHAHVGIDNHPLPLRPSVAHKQPRTFTPQWKAAEAKYRAMQKQDPIRNM
eukprot:scaffold230760_cov39-Tisochrysis_lutea.AAC.1